MARDRTDRFTKSMRRPTRRKHFFKGIPVVPGIAIGTVHLKFRKSHTLSDRHLEPGEIERELGILAEAQRQAKEQLLIARARVAEEIGEIEATIFDTHIALLEDRSLIPKVREQVRQDLRPVEVVVGEIVEGYYHAMAVVDSEHMRARAADIRDVGSRLLDNVLALKSDQQLPALEDKGMSGDVVFARELLPSDLGMIERRHLAGVVTEAGSNRGHVAVMLRALNIPTVMGVETLAEVLTDGDQVIVDGSSGAVIVNPTADILQSYRKTQKDYANFHAELAKEVALPAATRDGTPVGLYANISKQSELPLAHLYQLDGVGLYRTEFHLMVRDAYPSEEDQYRVYRDVVEAMKGRSLTIRTMDIGSDKHLPYLKLPPADNPALGRRSIRLAFDLEEMQLVQLRAILRASAHGSLRILFPFITAIEDLRHAKRLLRQASRDLAERGLKHDEQAPVGMMVEVPAAALSLSQYAREVEFVSVGTNDLVQYVCAAARDQSDVEPWYRGYNPGVLRLLQKVVADADEGGIDLTICGEMAGDPLYTMFLLGIGCRKLSMAAPAAPLVKRIVRSVDLEGARRLVQRSLQLSSTAQIRQLFQGSIEQIVGRDLHAWSSLRE